MRNVASPLAMLCAILCAIAPILLQGQTESGPFQPSIIETTESSADHQLLTAAVKAVDLDQVLNSDGPFTVFAPSDEAFKELSPEYMEKLLKPENYKELKKLLSYHIVAGNLTAARILKALCRGEGKTSFTTIEGKEITATMDGIDIVLADEFGNLARITSADSTQCNGVIHVIDRVIHPELF